MQRKQWRDTWEASRHARACGCFRCREYWKSTLAFYAKLGSDKPQRESAGSRWYERPYGEVGVPNDNS